MKYPCGQHTVEAVYEQDEQKNPLLSALPPFMAKEDFMSAMAKIPKLPGTLTNMPANQRQQKISEIQSLFVPLGYMYYIYDLLYRAISTTYRTRGTINSILRINEVFRGIVPETYGTQAETGAILGVPGIGKTSAIEHILSMMPHVINHTEFSGSSFVCNQVLYLRVECPSDCSIKTMALEIIAALDAAIGSSYLKRLSSLRAAATSNLAIQVKILCMTHHVGLIVVDEIQNAVLTAQMNKQVKPLIKFLVELTNDTCTAIYFVGTPEAEELFVSQEHLKRRTRGLRLLPFLPDGTYRSFLELLWRFQYTPKHTKLTEQLANKIFDQSAGIPAYIIKIFQESQAIALIQGFPSINASLIQQAVQALELKVPHTFWGGMSISNFEAIDEPTDAVIEDFCDMHPQNRVYANKRGRKAAPRDDKDILAAFLAGADVKKHLETHEMLEVFKR